LLPLSVPQLEVGLVALEHLLPSLTLFSTLQLLVLEVEELEIFFVLPLSSNAADAVR